MKTTTKSSISHPPGLVAQIMQSINHQIGICIDAVVCFPGIGVMSYLNGLIDPFRIAKTQQGLRLG